MDRVIFSLLSIPRAREILNPSIHCNITDKICDDLYVGFLLMCSNIAHNLHLQKTRIIIITIRPHFFSKWQPKGAFYRENDSLFPIICFAKPINLVIRRFINNQVNLIYFSYLLSLFSVHSLFFFKRFFAHFSICIIHLSRSFFFLQHASFPLSLTNIFLLIFY